MKYILLSIVSVLLLPGMVLAQTLDLQTTTTSVDINNWFGATIVVDSIQWGDVAIAGIENFEVVSQSRSQSIQIINGSQTAQITLNLNLKPKETWTFTLGPATIQTPQWVVSSQSVLIEVAGDRLFGSSSAVLNTSQNTSSDSGRSFYWVWRVFWVLLVWLMIRVFKVARRKNTIVSQAYTHAPDSVLSNTHSWWYWLEWAVQKVVMYAKSTTSLGWNPSITEIRLQTQDGVLAWLLQRIEKQTYSGEWDALLEEDCIAYLTEQNAYTS